MFSPSKKVPVDRRKQSSANLSYIGAEAEIMGGISTKAQFHIDGRIEGDIRCHFLTQGHSGAIVGNIIADEARIAGLVDGMVSAVTLVLEPTARVTGDVSCETLSIATGAQVEGRFVCRPGTAAARDEQGRDSPPLELLERDILASAPAPGLFSMGDKVTTAAE